MSVPIPEWLQVWREGRSQPQRGEQPPTQPHKHTAKGIAPTTVSANATAAVPPPAIPAMSASARASKNLGFIEPERWSYDGGLRREVVLDIDHIPARVVRKVGWRNCMTCANPFFSEDVIAQRLCRICCT
ncbi:hypothetical protein LJR251_001371 [Rhizobium rhizogenes]|uniref:hypothetical protein n=1 Tax=Rhizobium rhizogenes TaxID=359 RepID=UPI003ECE5FEC